MKVNVSLSAFGEFTRKNIEMEASTITEVLDNLSTMFGENFQSKFYDETGKPRRFINIYVNGRDYRFLKKLETQLTENDEITLIPAVSGG